jgi:mRNA interferase MazF
MNKWDVVLISFPFTDLTATKVRPAIVISPNSYHQNGQDGLFMLITSNTERRATHDIIISDTHPEYAQTGLKKESCVRVSKIVTLNKSLVVHKLGSLGARLSLLVEAQLRFFLELPPHQPPLTS